MRLQDIGTEALQALMSQCYHPVQQLQALGGEDAAVNEAASRLLDRLMAVDAE
jgi:hypothetical protein